MTRPGLVSPAPSVPAGLSPAPATIGIPAARPHSMAVSSVRRPITSLERTIRGRRSLSMPKRPQIASDHASRPMSAIPVKFR